MSALFLLPVLMLAGSPCCPQQPEKKEAKVKVTVVVILASERYTHIHKQLQAIAAHVQIAHKVIFLCRAFHQLTPTRFFACANRSAREQHRE